MRAKNGALGQILEHYPGLHFSKIFLPVMGLGYLGHNQE
jgi:hypothetical protein